MLVNGDMRKRFHARGGGRRTRTQRGISGGDAPSEKEEGRKESLRPSKQRDNSTARQIFVGMGTEAD